MIKLLYFLFGWLFCNTVTLRPMLISSDGDFYLEGSPMVQRIKNSILFFTLTIVALVSDAVAAATGITVTGIDGLVSISSSDSAILRVEPQADGTYKIYPGIPGQATLTISGDADLGEGVKTITSVYEFEVYDDRVEAGHFGITIADIVYKSPDPSANTVAAVTGDAPPTPPTPAPEVPTVDPVALAPESASTDPAQTA